VFLVLPGVLKHGFGVRANLCIDPAMMAVAYLVAVPLLARIGITV
jgi:hypothetical protein